MLRIGIAADSHGDWSTLDRWATANDLALVVHCGDCGSTPAEGVSVWSARGNHDLGGQHPGGRPVFVDDYQVVELGGLRWLFVGCSTGLAEVAPAPPALPAADVVISHESPFNPHLGWPGHPTVRAVVERVRPRWCFSGHWHHPARATLGATSCVALGAEPRHWLVVGLRGGALHLEQPG